MMDPPVVCCFYFLSFSVFSCNVFSVQFLLFLFSVTLFLKGAILIKLITCIIRYAIFKVWQLEAFVTLTLCCKANTCLPHLKQSFLVHQNRGALRYNKDVPYLYSAYNNSHHFSNCNKLHYCTHHTSEQIWLRRFGKNKTQTKG